MVDQDGAEGHDGLVVKIAAGGGAVSPLGYLKRRYAELEQPGSGARVLRLPCSSWATAVVVNSRHASRAASTIRIGFSFRIPG